MNVNSTCDITYGQELEYLQTFAFSCEEKLSYNSYYQLYKSIVNSLTTMNYCYRICFGFSGIIGGILEMIVLAHKEFSKPSFIYIKVLVVTDIFYSGLCLFLRSFLLIYCEKSDLLTYTNDMILAFSNVCCFAVEILALFMNFERFVAVWFPIHFSLINRREIAFSVSIISIGLSLLYCEYFATEKLIYSNVTQSLILINTEFGDSSMFETFDYFVFCFELIIVYTLLAFSIAVALGLAKTRFSDKEKRLLTMLTLLCSFPIVLNVTCFVVRSVSLSGAKLGVKAAKLSYSQAVLQINMSLANSAVYVVQLLSEVVPHCLHFYLYVLLSKTFREHALQKFFYKSKINPINIVSSVTATTRANQQSSAV